MTNEAANPDITIIVPLFNERETVVTLFEKIQEVIDSQVRKSYEVIFIDDGSTDGSWDVINNLVKSVPAVQAIRLRTNFGKAEALALGSRKARGRIFITMDADLQDDPVEIPRFIEQLDQGFDLVTGWKKDRRDPISKTLPSKIFNSVTAAVCGLKLRDFNCGYKAGRREVFQSMNLYGELHRYIPVIAHNAGYRVGEIPIIHQPRRFGKSKYGSERYLRGFLDLLTVITITRYGRRPGHLFGGIGIIIGALGGGILVYLAYLRLVLGELIGDRPLLLFGAMLTLVSIQFLLFGMLSELILNRTRPTEEDNLVAEEAKHD